LVFIMDSRRRISLITAPWSTSRWSPLWNNGSWRWKVLSNKLIFTTELYWTKRKRIDSKLNLLRLFLRKNNWKDNSAKTDSYSKKLPKQNHWKQNNMRQL
jgi:hypothetical protein